MYLIKGDTVTILDEKTDDKGQKWRFINLKGTKDLNMWIKAEAVDIPDNKDIPKEEKAVLEEVSKIPQSSTSSPNTLAVTKEKFSITATDKIIATKVDQKK